MMDVVISKSWAKESVQFPRNLSFELQQTVSTNLSILGCALWPTFYFVYNDIWIWGFWADVSSGSHIFYLLRH